MKKTIIGLIIVVIGIAGAYFYYNNSAHGLAKGQQKALKGEGDVIFVITDKSVDTKSVSEVEMTVSRLEMYSPATGWVVISSQPQTYNLLQLKTGRQLALAGRMNISAGTYSKVSMTIDKVVIVKGKTGPRLTARLPAKTFTVDTSVMVNGHATSTVILDIAAERSLHRATNGEYVFTPVVKVEAQSNVDANVSANVVVSITGGSVTSDITAGMDLNGNVKQDFDLSPNTIIKVEGGTLKIGGSGIK